MNKTSSAFAALRFSMLLLGLTWLLPGASAQQVIRMSTTTSTENSGLLRHLLPQFEKQSGIKIQIIAVGSGKALALARNGDVDLTLIHAPELERQFVAEGHGIGPWSVMVNDFLIVGPSEDPAGIRGEKDVLAALRKIVARKAKFISRGDDSGTDQREKAYWKQIGTQPSGRAYVSAGLGMGAVLSMAAQLQAYTLTDRATFGAYRGKSDLVIAVEGDVRMLNPYSIIAVNPAKYTDIKYEAALQFIRWLTSEQGQNEIARFQVNGQHLFFPTAQEKR